MYQWHGVYITVGKIDPNGKWADIHCVIPVDTNAGPYDKGRVRHEWDKQQPLTDGHFPDDWDKIKAPQ